MIRCFDILFAACALLVLSPALLPIAIVLRLTGEGEIFFIQKRVGRDGKEFGLIKFATMLKNSPNIGTGTITVKDDPRVLPAGKLLRKTKINELPQLLNVLVGQMSLIGPRPLSRQNFDIYSPEQQKKIASVRPGLSGVGSIIFRDEERLLASDEVDPVEFYRSAIAPYKAEVEEWWVDHVNLRIYFFCMIATVWVILHPSSNLLFAVLPSLPKMPSDLRSAGMAG